MTTELEKQFFDTFGIEPKYYCSYHDCNCPIEDVGKFNKECPKQAVTKECDARSHKAIYPQITDRHYLELLKLLMIDEGIKINVYNIQDESKSYKELGITCLDYFYEEPECNEEDYEPIQSTGTLEECILKALILIEEKYKGYLKHQVQAIFNSNQ